MSGRRHHQRFALSEPQSGALEVLEHADIESDNGREFVMTTRATALVGEDVTLYLADAAEIVSVRARVVESQRHVKNGAVYQRVRLARLDETPAPGGSNRAASD
jgi:hypothetical protein